MSVKYIPWNNTVELKIEVLASRTDLDNSNNYI